MIFRGGKIMGVLNVTPDSFSDGGKYFQLEDAIAHAHQMVNDGADCIDVGGLSSRPFQKQQLTVEEELARVIPVISILSKEIAIPISIDTYHAEVMLRACEAGASLINDIYALQQPGALHAAKSCGVPVILMHMKGTPETMQIEPNYEDVVLAVNDFFAARIEACLEAGIEKKNIILDPGFGFGKNFQHNKQLLKSLNVFKQWQLAILVGLSRKSMIQHALNLPLNERMHASVALAVYAILQGANWVRVHDVAATRQALDMIAAVEAEA